MKKVYRTGLKCVKLLEDSHMQENLFFSDGVTFYVGGLVNKHNIRYWFETNPHVTIENVMSSPKLNIWCTISKNKLLGSYFFEDDTVNGENYLLMFFIPEIRKLHKLRSIVFQQDGAPPHFSIDVRLYLDNHLPGRWIGRGGSIRWVSRSPDLTQLDFFLWEHIKNNVYKTPIKDITELKRRIETEIKSISKETLCNAFSNISKRMDLVDGNHFEYLL